MRSRDKYQVSLRRRPDDAGLKTTCVLAERVSDWPDAELIGRRLYAHCGKLLSSRRDFLCQPQDQGPSSMSRFDAGPDTGLPTKSSGAGRTPRRPGLCPRSGGASQTRGLVNCRCWQVPFKDASGVCLLIESLDRSIVSADRLSADQSFRVRFGPQSFGVSLD